MGLAGSVLLLRRLSVPLAPWERWKVCVFLSHASEEAALTESSVPDGSAVSGAEVLLLQRLPSPAGEATRERDLPAGARGLLQPELCPPPAHRTDEL